MEENNNVVGTTSKTSELPVRVAVRVRPLITSEKRKGENNVVNVDKKTAQAILGKDRCFAFDFAYGIASKQEEIYNDIVKPLETKLFQGYNATLLAYGQTGSGKTYTMGTAYNESLQEEFVGITPRVINSIFNRIEQEEKDNIAEYKVNVSFLEIHNENINDLLFLSNEKNINILDENDLNNGAGGNTNNNVPTVRSKSIKHPTINVRENQEGEIILAGLSEESVSNVDEIYQRLKRGSLVRQTGSTNMNAESSRSHAIFTISIHRENLESNNNNDCQNCAPTCSKFHLVDLAGSERVKKTKAAGSRLREGININKGLLALGNVISALGDPTKKRSEIHVPYRNSKLTRILQDSLGGNSYTAMIACVSPSDSNVDETINTLRYAHRARNIKNKPIVNTDPTQLEMQRLRQQVTLLQKQLLQGKGNIDFRNDNATSGSNSSSNNTNYSKQFSDMEKENVILKQDKRNLADENIRLDYALQAMTKKCKDHMDELLAVEAERDRLKLAMEENDQNILVNGYFDNGSSKQSVLEEKMNEIKVLRCKVERLEAEITLKPNASIDNINFEKELLSMYDEFQNGNVISNKKNNGLFGENEEEDEKEVEEISASIQFAEHEHQSKQNSLGEKINQIESSMKQKEDLIKRINGNMTDDKVEKMKKMYEINMKKLSTEVKTLTEDREKLLRDLQRAKNEPTNENVTKYKTKLRKLERQLAGLKQKQIQQQRLLKLKSSADNKINQLQKDISNMKIEKVKLTKQKVKAGEKFRHFKAKQEMQLSKLKKENHKRQIEYQKLKTAHDRQSVVLKRKLQEAATARARLDTQNKKKLNAQNIRKNKDLRITEATIDLRKRLENYLKQYHIYETLKDQLKFQVQQRAGTKERFDSLLRCKKSKLSLFSKEKETEMKELEKKLAIYSAEIMEINNNMLESKIEEEQLSELWSNIHTMSEAKHIIKHAVKTLEHSIKKERKAKMSVNRMRNEYLDIKKLMSTLKEQKAALSHSFERKLMQLQNDHEEHMSLILEQVVLPVSKSNASTEMTPEKKKKKTMTSMHRDNNNTTSFTSDIDTTRDISNHKNDAERKKNFNNAHVTKKANEEFMVYESLSESDIAEDDKEIHNNNNNNTNLSNNARNGKKKHYALKEQHNTDHDNNNTHHTIKKKNQTAFMTKRKNKSTGLRIYNDNIDSPPSAPSSKTEMMSPPSQNNNNNKNKYIKSSLNIQMPSMTELRNIMSKGKSSSYMSKAMKRKEQFSYKQLHERKEALQKAKKKVVASRREKSNRALKQFNR